MSASAFGESTWTVFAGTPSTETVSIDGGIISRRRRGRRFEWYACWVSTIEVFRSSHPSVEHLRASAERRMPGFAFDYLEGGCHSNLNLKENTDAIRAIKLAPYYLRDFAGADLTTELLGQTYSAPFGIAPIGLQGLMWPRATEYLAQAAFEANVPFILSTGRNRGHRNGRSTHRGPGVVSALSSDRRRASRQTAGSVTGGRFAGARAVGRHAVVWLSAQRDQKRTVDSTSNDGAKHPADGDQTDLVMGPTYRRGADLRDHATLSAPRPQPQTSRSVYEQDILRSIDHRQARRRARSVERQAGRQGDR